MWILIVEDFKILNYEEPPAKCRNIFERTFNLSYLSLHALYLNIEKTFTFKNLIDYLVCLYKPKYKHKFTICNAQKKYIFFKPILHSQKISSIYGYL